MEWCSKMQVPCHLKEQVDGDGCCLDEEPEKKPEPEEKPEPEKKPKPEPTPTPIQPDEYDGVEY